MALSCDLASLTAASRCFNCLSATEKEALKVYFIAQTLKSAGGPDLTNLNVRNQASACLACEPDFVLDSMEVALWQNTASGLGVVLPSTISGLRALVRCAPCGEQKTTRAAYVTLLCQFFSALEWASRVVANGGAAPSQNTISAVNAFSRAIAPIRSNIYHLNVFAPDSIAALRTPLIKDYGLGLWVPHTVGTGFAETIGVNGWRGYTDASNGIVYDCGVIPSAVPAFNSGNGGMSLCTPDNPPTLTNNIAAGCIIAATGIRIIPRSNPGANCLTGIWSTAISATSASIGGAFVSANRVSTTDVNLSFGNSTTPYAKVATNVTANAVDPIAIPIAVGGGNNNGTYAVCPQSLSFFAVHDGLTLAQSTILFNAVNALRTSFGGGFL